MASSLSTTTSTVGSRSSPTIARPPADRSRFEHPLSHTSGLRDFFEPLIIARGRFEEERITDADATAVVNRQKALNFKPGEEYGYSNTNYLLAAKIAERVSGQRFAAFVASRIFAPLGMTHSRLRDDVTVLIPGRAVGYTKRGDEWQTSTPNYDVVGPTNLETTVGDLLRLAENLERPTVGDSAIVRQMLTPGVLASGDTTAYGLGCRSSAIAGSAWPSTRGAIRDSARTWDDGWSRSSRSRSSATRRRSTRWGSAATSRGSRLGSQRRRRPLLHRRRQRRRTPRRRSDGWASISSRRRDRSPS